MLVGWFFGEIRPLNAFCIDLYINIKEKITNYFEKTVNYNKENHLRCCRSVVLEDLWNYAIYSIYNMMLMILLIGIYTFYHGDYLIELGFLKLFSHCNDLIKNFRFSIKLW